jgi:hypothetical protein
MLTDELLDALMRLLGVDVCVTPPRALSAELE